MDAYPKPFDTLPLSRAQVSDLRSDHAGECGAVMIYRGILAVSRDPEVRRFSRRHLETELAHRRFFMAWLPGRYRSRLTGVWNLSGWLLGATAALCGARTVFRTIAAVETFVEKHYLEQIAAMRLQPELADLAAKLQAFCDDEVEHRDDALDRYSGRSGAVPGVWPRLIGAGSSLGVAIARRI